MIINMNLKLPLDIYNYECNMNELTIGPWTRICMTHMITLIYETGYEWPEANTDPFQ